MKFAWRVSQRNKWTHSLIGRCDNHLKCDVWLTLKRYISVVIFTTD